ncbi:unnamed protein product, partial [Haemonchus placei]|uniref:Pept_C1 domain-containing protein n=1 Tax=Haemonchus placei TaxID=6290 RepID=A0A0N4X9H7_HAEPC
CEGGWPIKAFRFFADQGAVTGGDYDDKDCCLPYPFHPCGRHGNDTYYGECWRMASTPKCERTCQKTYKKSYTSDRTQGYFRMLRGSNHCRIEEFVVAGHRYIEVALSICLSHVAFASEADVLGWSSFHATTRYSEEYLAVGYSIFAAAIRNEKTPRSAQAEITPHSYNVQHKIMDLRFINQNRKPVVEDASDKGFFRMVRGTNHCGIEEEVVAGHVRG